jgi:hypothetical protein
MSEWHYLCGNEAEVYLIVPSQLLRNASRLQPIGIVQFLGTIDTDPDQKILRLK